MFHAGTERMIDYWTSRAQPGQAPSRAAIQPADFRQQMAQVFILGWESRGCYPFRLVGGLVGDLHRRDLRGVNGLSLWAHSDRARLEAALEGLRDRPEPLVASAEAVSGAGVMPLEVMFAPLVSHDGAPDRILGLYQPLSMTARLQGQAVRTLALRTLRRPGAANEEGPKLKLAAVDGRRVA